MGSLGKDRYLNEVVLPKLQQFRAELVFADPAIMIPTEKAYIIARAISVRISDPYPPQWPHYHFTGLRGKGTCTVFPFSFGMLTELVDEAIVTVKSGRYPHEV